MSEWSMLGSVAILAAAGFAHGLFGLGFAMISTPLLALFLDYRAAVLLVALPSLLMASSWLVVNRRQLRISRMPASLLPAIGIGASIGAALQTGLPERVLLFLLASLLLRACSRLGPLRGGRLPRFPLRREQGLCSADWPG